MAERLNHNSKVCPHCGANLVGDPIPEKYLEHYNKLGAPREEWDTFNFSRLIGIEIQGRDRTDGWMCPDCQVTDWENGTTTSLKDTACQSPDTAPSVM